MIALDRGITAYTDRFLLSRSVSPDYANTLRQRIDAYCAWAGNDVPIDSLNCDLGNEWLQDLADGGMSAWSLVGYRGALLTIWNDAFQAGENENPPLRLRRIKKPRLVVEAYTHVEIKLLLKAASRLARKHRDGNYAKDFWAAAIHVAYCCGPRRGDLLAVEWKQISPDGVLSFVQHKTGFPNNVVLSKEALRLCRRLRGDGRLLPYPYNEDWFTTCFKRLRNAAKIERGTFKWIRRSAGSYAEKVQKGAGARLLGHRDESVFRRFYDDPTISGQRPTEPPPL
jgi:integrase